MPRMLDRKISLGRLIIAGAGVILAAALWTWQTGPNGPAGGGAVQQAAADPQDAPGWRALGEARFAAGQYAEAAGAYARAVALAPGSAAGWSALGEARVMASAHDPMPAEALKDFHQAVAIDAREPRARYFLAVAKDLKGDHQGAIADWLALLADTPPGAPWEGDLRRTIAQVGRVHNIAVAAQLAAVHQPAAAPVAAPVMAGIAGPTAQDLAAAAAIPPSQQQAMAQAMVARLEQRLAADPHNGDGWIMLIRSRMTLDGPPRASAALAQALAADPADAAQVKEAAKALGVR